MKLGFFTKVLVATASLAVVASGVEPAYGSVPSAARTTTGAALQSAPTTSTAAAEVAQTLSWSTPTLVDHQVPFGGSAGYGTISCPTPTLCVTIGNSGEVGYVATSSDPMGGAGTWSVVSHIDDSNLPFTVSCPTTTLCVALDASGNVITSTNPTGGKSAWTVTPVTTFQDGFSDIACPSESLCIAVTRGGNLWVSTNPTGGTAAWTQTVVGGGMTRIKCPGISLCVAVDYSGNVITSTNPTGGASAWTKANIDGNNSLQALACPTATLCVTADDAGALLSSTNPTGGAGAWSSVQLTNYPKWSITGATLSCPSTSLCVLGETYYGLSVPGELFTSTNPTGGASAWTGSSTPLNTVTCLSASACLGTYGGNLVVSTNPTGGPSAWTYSHLAAGVNAITGISCPTPTLCVSVDNAGNVLTSTDPASGSWTFAHVDGDPLDPIGFAAVSCPTANLCVAVDRAGNVFTSSNPTGGAGAWSGVNVNSHPFRSLSCASESLCVAGDDNGDVVAATIPTGGYTAWKSTHIDSFTGLNYLSGISCPSNALCVAVDGAGNHFLSGNPADPVPNWTRIAVAGSGLLGISCPSEYLCVSVGLAGVVVAQTITLEGVGHAAWTIDSGHQLSAISCPSISLCVVVDELGNVLTSTNPTGGPDTWSTTPSVDAADAFISVTCPSTALCVAGDAIGQVAVGRYIAPPVAPTFTATPAPLAKSQQATFAWTHPDPSVTFTCVIDNNIPFPCSSPYTTPVLFPASHSFWVRAVNQAGGSGPMATFNWSIDIWAPTATVTYPTTLNGPTTLHFSEGVLGVSTSSVQLRVDGTSTPTTVTYVCKNAAAVAVSCGGLVSYVVLTPASGAALIPGQYYRPYVSTAVKDVAGNTFTQTLARFRASTVEQETSLRAVYAWRAVASSLALGGTYVTEHTAGASASFSFKGTYLTWYTITGPTQGWAYVYIDNVLKAKVNTYASTYRYRVPYGISVGGASTTSHTLKIIVAGLKGSTVARDSLVAIDAIKVGTTTYTSPALTHTWQSSAWTGASGGRYATSDIAGAGVTFTFRGTAVTWYAVLGANQGYARVYVDGVLKATVSGYSSVKRILARKYYVTSGVHTFRIVATGTHATGSTGNWVGVDRWAVS